MRSLTSMLRRFMSVELPKKRHFVLRFSLKPQAESSLSEHDINDLTRKTETGQDHNQILFASSNLAKTEFYYVFEAENEVLPYDFMQSTELKKDKKIDSFEIKEIDLVQTDMTRDVVKMYSHLAAFDRPAN